jgi:hypothetical protein
MFNFLGRKSSRELWSARRRVLPLLERLETRDCPAAPVITAPPAAVLTGAVTADYPASVVITFSDAVSGAARAATSGQFNYATLGNGLGAASGCAADGPGLTSDRVVAQVRIPAPYIAYSVTYGSGRTVTLSGRVTGADRSGLTVSFRGVVTGSAVTNADGTFSYTAAATGLGNVRATTVDRWGQHSNTATVTLSADPPEITEFEASDGPDGWTFHGRVSDQYVAGMTIAFGGLPELTNRTTTVRTDGTFSFTIQLSSWDYGTATARATDCWGLVSDPALTDVPPG